MTVTAAPDKQASLRQQQTTRFSKQYFVHRPSITVVQDVLHDKMLLPCHLYDTAQNAQTYGRNLTVSQLHLLQKHVKN